MHDDRERARRAPEIDALRSTLAPFVLVERIERDAAVPSAVFPPPGPPEGALALSPPAAVPSPPGRSEGALARPSSSVRPDGTLILTAYHLVGRGEGRRYREAVERAAPATGALRIQVSGPWPPYAFCREVRS